MEILQMSLSKTPIRLLLAGAFLAALSSTAAMPAASAASQAAPMALASHRAVYDLKLSSTRGKRSMSAVRGRILYDFSGNACDGYALQFRQVSELDSGEGKVAVSDLRATSWEDGEAKRLRFHSQNYFDDNLRDKVDGQAERDKDGVAVKLTEPDEKKIDLAADLAFPTEHVRRIIAAAREGKTLLQVSVYDGSDTGEKIYDTLTVIGKAIAPDAAKPDDATAKEASLANMTRWPVTISYFDRAAKDKDGEQTPVYAITFELYENGVSRALLLDYGDFVLTGEMTSLELKDKDAKSCK
jgi:EipB-like